MYASANTLSRRCTRAFEKMRNGNRKTMCLSSLLRKTGTLALSLHVELPLDILSVTAIVKAGAENLATTVNRLEGLVKSEQKAQFWADRTRSCLGFHWPCPPDSPVAVKLSGLLWASSITCLREPAMQLWAIISIWSTGEHSLLYTLSSYVSILNYKFILMC